MSKALSVDMRGHSGEGEFCVTSLNIGPRVEVEVFGRRVFTAFGKYPVDHPITLDRFGIMGDGHYGRDAEEALDHAVQMCCSDNRDFWSHRFSKELSPGAFGESITYDGPGERRVRIGDIVQVGSARLQVTGPRVPCAKLAHHLGQEIGFVQEYHRSLRTGIYARVLQPGSIAVGDKIGFEETDGSLPLIADATALLLEREPDPQRLRSLADDVRISIMLRLMYRKKAEAVIRRKAQ